MFAHNVIHQRDIICILFVPSWILPLKLRHLHLFLFSDKKTTPQGSQWRGSPLNGLIGQIHWNKHWHWTNICVQRYCLAENSDNVVHGIWCYLETLWSIMDYSMSPHDVHHRSIPMQISTFALSTCTLSTEGYNVPWIRKLIRELLRLQHIFLHFSG